MYIYDLVSSYSEEFSQNACNRQATHTSEDNESFNVLQEKTVEDHKQRYHWAYDVDESRGDPKLHLLPDGSWISKEQRRLVDEVCAPKGTRFTVSL